MFRNVNLSTTTTAITSPQSHKENQEPVLGLLPVRPISRPKRKPLQDITNTLGKK